MQHILTGYDRSTAHHHDTVAQARECQAEAFNDEANARAEFEMERRAERYWEERGANTYTGSEEEARDRWLDGIGYFGA